jgi:hypothetical protein
MENDIKGSVFVFGSDLYVLIDDDHVPVGPLASAIVKFEN